MKEDMAMKNLDLTPFWRSTVGFDRLFDLMENEVQANYPPYNIERTGEDTYEVMLALAGFTPDEVSITTENSVLTIEGRKEQKGEHTYLYQGISARPFRRQFNLADHVEVKDATWDNGLLKIELVREVPEAMKPRRIKINSGGDRIAGVPTTAMEGKKAA